jgi:hypothetical protein
MIMVSYMAPSIEELAGLVTMDTSSNFDNSGQRENADAVKHRTDELKAEGWSEVIALVPPGTGVIGKSGHRPQRSEAAQRKAAERERDLANGVRQVNVKVVDDPQARDVVSQVAAAMKSRKMRSVVRMVLTDPELCAIGLKVRRLRGERGEYVRKVLGV